MGCKVMPHGKTAETRSGVAISVRRVFPTLNLAPPWQTFLPPLDAQTCA
jgi:hypothetical protein